MRGGGARGLLGKEGIYHLRLAGRAAGGVAVLALRVVGYRYGVPTSGVTLGWRNRVRARRG